GQHLLSEILFDARRPRWIGELGVDEIGRPPTPEDGAAAKAKGKPWEILIEAHRTIGLPGLTPHRTGTALAGRVEVGRQVLNVLRQRERAPSRTRTRRRWDASMSKRCVAVTAPKLPPPITMTSNGLPSEWMRVSWLAVASSSVLQT